MEHGGLEWERLLGAERQLQSLVPGTVLVGGAAAALHAGHRISQHADQVLADLAERFDDVLADLEAAPGWTTDRVQRPVAIHGELHGVVTGVRQLRRVSPLETEVVQGLRVPTLAETARIKGWLLATRITTRDYLDTVVLFERLGEAGARAAMASLDEIYPQPTGGSVLAELVERLGAGEPADRATTDLADLRGLVAPWDRWESLVARGRAWARVLIDVLLASEGVVVDLGSDEVLTRLLDHGDLAEWRVLYRMAGGPSASSAELRRRVVRICASVPLSFPHLHLAAMAALGEMLDPYPDVPSSADDIA